ncbi:MAG: Asp-tRNA(Asn)/Glu-tRNA(Gln) amidotransferase subunit GatC [Thermodesulfobacteriota bacterium]
MKISKDEVKDTAELARLEFSENELELFTGQLGRILDYIEDLNELDTENIEPTSHVLEISTPLREDKVTQLISVDEALANAPETNDGFFIVPKVIED